MSCLKTYLTCAILAMNTYHVLAQTISFEKLTTQNGLSNNKVNCVVQDKRGFMWIGTEDGLNRFDGNEFVVFRNNPGDRHGISGNIITGLHIDAAGIMWIATADGGLTRYNYRLPYTEQFKRYKNLQNDPHSIPGNIVNALIEDKQGYLWLAMSGQGILRFDKKTSRFHKLKYKGVQTCLALSLRNDTIWAGMQGSGILKIDTRTLNAESDKLYTNAYLKLPHVVVSSLYTDRAKNVWFGSWDNILYRYNHATGKEENFSGSLKGKNSFDDETTAFSEDRNGRLWIGSKYEGLHIYDPANQSLVNMLHDQLKEGSLIQNKINCIYRGQNGMMWIGTDRGISKYNPYRQQFVQQFLPLKSSAHQNGKVYDFYYDEAQTLWIGTSDGLFKREMNDTGFTHIPLRFNNTTISVTKIYKAQNGDFYLGSDYSLFRFDPRINRIALLPDRANDLVMKRIIASRIRSVTDFTIAGKPVLLASPYGHFLAYYDYEQQKWVSRADSTRSIISAWQLKDNLIQRFYKNSTGKLWMATAKQGLAEWVDGKKPFFRYYVNDPLNYTSISNNHVYDMAEAPNGHLWVTTYGGGLNHFNTSTQKFTHISGPANLLQGITVTHNGNVWMVSNGSLHRYDPKKQESTVFVLPDVENSGGISGDIYQDKTGKLYVAGSNYFIRFNPAEVAGPPRFQKPVFTDFMIFDSYRNELLFRNVIRLKHNQNFFSLKFSSPDYFNNGNVSYSYMLEGLDERWNNAGVNNLAGYTNLPPGEYVFKVTASGGRNGVADQVASVKIIIIPPFWQRWWFYILAASSVCLLIYSVYRYRINELIKRQSIRNKIAQDLHDHVGSTLSSISVYSQVAQIKKSANENEELDSLLHKISAVSNEMVSEMNDIVWAINPVNDSLDKIIARIEVFAKPLLRANNINFHIDRDRLPQGLDLGMEKSKEVYLIMKEAINNCLKHAAARNLYLTMRQKHHHIHISIKDDGHGFNHQQSEMAALSGNGLRNIKSRVNAINGKMSITSNTSGTLLEVEF